MIFENRFKGQIAIITGGARGIGLGIGTRIAKEGGTVILVDLNDEALSDARTSIGDVPGQVATMRVDITAETQVEQMMQAVMKQFGQIDVVVNSAVVLGPTATNITDYDTDAFREALEVNVTGSFIVTKHAVKTMQGRGYGRILLLSSMAGKDGNPGMAGYTTSKAAVIGLVKGIAKEVATTQITINGLAPTAIATPMNLITAEKHLDAMTNKIPMGRMGTLEEVAALACWIVSEEAAFTTGFVFDLSGGRATY
jgi:NAD(P)-dependent dehydrogenase (short-subunit alcohol dehydrogenase family)